MSTANSRATSGSEVSPHDLVGTTVDDMDHDLRRESLPMAHRQRQQAHDEGLEQRVVTIRCRCVHDLERINGSSRVPLHVLHHGRQPEPIGSYVARSVALAAAICLRKRENDEYGQTEERRTKILWTTIETTTTPVIHVARASKTRRCVRSDFTNAMGPYCRSTRATASGE